MVTGLIRRNGRYSTRRVIPLDLQGHYGRKEIVRALGTADPDKARRAHAMAWLELELEFEAAREKLGLVQPDSEDDATQTPVTEMSPTIISLVEIDRLRENRDQAAKEGGLAGFMHLQRDTLRLTQAMLNGEVEPTRDLRHLEGRSAIGRSTISSLSMMYPC